MTTNDCLENVVKFTCLETAFTKKQRTKFRGCLLPSYSFWFLSKIYRIFTTVHAWPYLFV